MTTIKSRLIVFCCLAVIGIVVGSCDIGGDDGEKWFVVTGTVIDSSTGLPIAKVSMSWGDTAPGTPVSLTDSSGQYRLQTPQSASTVYAKKEGYRSHARGIPSGITGGTTLWNIDFELQPE